MAPGGVVEAFDGVEQVCLRLCPRAVDFLADPLGFERGEEAFHGGIIPAANRAGDAIVGHQALELLTGILAAWSE